MSATKKSITTKPAKSPAPATKPAAPAAKPAAATAPKPAVAKKTARAASVQASAPARLPVAAAPRAVAVETAPVAKPSLAVKPAATPVTTTITARIDIGFGNALYVRGEGAGLSWDKGAAMECVGNDLWRIVLGESARGFVFKFLVNDLNWSTGPDYTTAAGSSVTLTPEF